MKVLFILIIITIGNLSIRAQYGRINKQIATKIINNETIIVLSDSDDAYNKRLKDIVRKYWKITDYTFEKRADLKTIDGVKNKHYNEYKNYLWLLNDRDEKIYYTYSQNGTTVSDPETTRRNSASLCFSIGGIKANKYPNALKLINDVVLFKSDVNQIKLAVNFIQNHIRAGLNGADITFFGSKSYHYQNKKIKLEKGCVLIFDKDLVEYGYGLIDKEYYEELADIKEYVKEKSVKKINVITPDVFDKEINSCPYYLERQVASGGDFVLYDLKTSEVVNLYRTKNSSGMYYKMAWRKCLKRFF